MRFDEEGPLLRPFGRAFVSHSKQAARILVVAVVVGASACTPPSSSPRVIAIQVAADRQFRSLPGWETVIRRRIEWISKQYEIDCGVKLAVAGIVPWDASGGGNLDQQRRQLKTDMRRTDADILLGLVHRRTSDPQLGSAVAFANTLVVLDFADQTEEYNALVLAHELGHVFGAGHVDDPQSVMAERPSTLRFDERSRAVITLMRQIDLRKEIGVLDSDAEEIMDRYAGILTGAEFNAKARAQTIWGASLLAEGHAEAAIRRFRNALTIDPEDTLARYELARALAETGNVPAAMTEFRGLLARDPDHADAHEQLGLLLATQGDIDGAIDAFDAAVRIAPDDATLRLNLGVALARRPEHLGDAIAQFEEAVRITPDYAAARRYLESARNARAEIDRVVADRRDAVRQKPGDANTRYNLGVALLRQGDVDGAAAELRRAIGIAPAHAEAHYNLAVALYSRAHYEEAWKELTTATTLGVTAPPSFVASIKDRLGRTP